MVANVTGVSGHKGLISTLQGGCRSRHIVDYFDPLDDGITSAELDLRFDKALKFSDQRVKVQEKVTNKRWRCIVSRCTGFKLQRNL